MINFLRHLFLPKESNNYRAALLQNKLLLTLTLFFFAAGSMVSFMRTNFPAVLGSFSDIPSQQLLILTNQERQQNGVSALADNPQLDQAAANKAADMFSKDYWAHNAPDGTTPWVFIKSAGYNYVYAGENLARGFTSAQDVTNAWMASPEHRANVLSSNYQNVGFAVATGKLSGEDTVLVVEMFGSTTLAPVASNPSKPTTVAIAPTSPSVVNTAKTAVVQQKSFPTQTAKTELLAASSSLKLIRPLINSQSLTVNIAKIVLSLFIFILILDMLIVERKKIVRFVGHNLDHVFFLSLMLIAVIFLVRGVII